MWTWMLSRNTLRCLLAPPLPSPLPPLPRPVIVLAYLMTVEDDNEYVLKRYIYNIDCLLVKRELMCRNFWTDTLRIFWETQRPLQFSFTVKCSLNLKKNLHNNFFGNYFNTPSFGDFHEIHPHFLAQVSLTEVVLLICQCPLHGNMLYEFNKRIN